MRLGVQFYPVQRMWFMHSYICLNFESVFIFKHSKSYFKNLKNLIKKPLEVANNVYQKRLRSQFKPLYILAYTKIIKSDKLYSVEMCIIHNKNIFYHFFVA
jgi:hypothetical protein